MWHFTDFVDVRWTTYQVVTHMRMLMVSSVWQRLTWIDFRSCGISRIFNSAWHSSYPTSLSGLMNLIVKLWSSTSSAIGPILKLINVFFSCWIGRKQPFLDMFIFWQVLVGWIQYLTSYDIILYDLCFAVMLEHSPHMNTCPSPLIQEVPLCALPGQLSLKRDRRTRGPACFQTRASSRHRTEWMIWVTVMTVDWTALESHDHGMNSFVLREYRDISKLFQSNHYAMLAS